MWVVVKTGNGCRVQIGIDHRRENFARGGFNANVVYKPTSVNQGYGLYLLEFKPKPHLGFGCSKGRNVKLFLDPLGVGRCNTGCRVVGRVEITPRIGITYRRLTL